jgi:hypothetical protein
VPQQVKHRVRGQVHGRASAVAMARNGGIPRLLAKCGSAVEVLDKQQIEDPALGHVTPEHTTGHTDSLPTMTPHSSRHDSKFEHPRHNAACGPGPTFTDMPMRGRQ